MTFSLCLKTEAILQVVSHVPSPTMYLVFTYSTTFNDYNHPADEEVHSQLFVRQGKSGSK